MAAKVEELPKVRTLPQAFVWRRLHSLTGLWLVLFLMEHLITNSQAALLLGESGQGFVRMVNALHNLPYLAVIEVALLGIPIAIHMIWGVKYALTSKPNSAGSEGKAPHLKYSRNRAYTWQRITSWILLVLLLLHVVKFRFLEYPHSVNVGSNPTYFVKVSMDPGLYTVAQRLNVKLYDGKTIDQMRLSEQFTRSEEALSNAAQEIRENPTPGYSPHDALILQSAQDYAEQSRLIDALARTTLKPGEVVATAAQFGTVSLLTVRDTFKSPIWVAIYTVFVVSACFHAFNGLWTSMLTWGWVIRATAQTRARKVAVFLMLAITCLGLAAVWGTYFWNLKH